MNRAERRKRVKEINTPQKVERFAEDIERTIRREYDKKNKQAVYNFIEAYTTLTAYVLHYKLRTR